MLVFVGENCRSEFTIDHFYYLIFPARVYNKKCNREPSLNLPKIICNNIVAVYDNTIIIIVIRIKVRISCTSVNA